MNKMENLMKKKKGMHEMSDVEKEAKMKAVEGMRDDAAKKIGAKIGGLKKVTIASPSKAGLHAGLEKAEEMLGVAEPGEADHEHLGMGEEMDEAEMSPEDYSKGLRAEGSPMEEASESPEEEMSEDEVDAKLAHLMALKQKLKTKPA